MRVILVFELCPDDLTVYDLIVNDEDLEWLRECHGKYGNQVGTPDDHPVNIKLSTWLEDKMGDIVYQTSKPENCTAPLDLSTGDYADKGKRLESRVEMIITGFLL